MAKILGRPTTDPVELISVCIPKSLLKKIKTNGSRSKRISELVKKGLKSEGWKQMKKTEFQRKVQYIKSGARKT